MECLEDQDIVIKGERGSIDYSYLQVVYNACRNETDGTGTICKSPEEIKKWLADKSILILENEQKFQPEDYELPVKEQTLVKLFKIAPNGAWKYPQLIREFELLLSDSLLSVGLLFRQQKQSFSIDR